jgi:hypothetical protein
MKCARSSALTLETTSACGEHAASHAGMAFSGSSAYGAWARTGGAAYLNFDPSTNMPTGTTGN